MGRGSSKVGSGGSGSGKITEKTDGVITLSEKDANYFQRVVQSDIQRSATAFDEAKNDTEKNYYRNELDSKMSRYSKALNVSEEDLKDMITGKKKIEIKKPETKTAKKQTENKKTFVNSFGEATTRYITNSTYERGRKRITKAMNDWFRGR